MRLHFSQKYFTIKHCLITRTVKLYAWEKLQHQITYQKYESNSYWCYLRDDEKDHSTKEIWSLAFLFVIRNFNIP